MGWGGWYRHCLDGHLMSLVLFDFAVLVAAFVR